MAGCRRRGEERSHGMSIDFGFWMTAQPMAPALLNAFQRSAVEE